MMHEMSWLTHTFICSPLTHFKASSLLEPESDIVIIIPPAASHLSVNHRRSDMVCVGACMCLWGEIWAVRCQGGVERVDAISLGKNPNKPSHGHGRRRDVHLASAWITARFSKPRHVHVLIFVKRASALAFSGSSLDLAKTLASYHAYNNKVKFGQLSMLQLITVRYNAASNVEQKIEQKTKRDEMKCLKTEWSINIKNTTIMESKNLYYTSINLDDIRVYAGLTYFRCILANM